jgi:hypothetical protein
MKKLLLVVALLSSAGCHASLQTAVNTERAAPFIEFQDTGADEALICKQKADAVKYIQLAGDDASALFKEFVQARLQSGDCKYMGNRDPITVKEHKEVLTLNGPLFAIRLTQAGQTWWSSANYYPETYPRTEDWEFQLLDTRFGPDQFIQK